jgi:Rrf2 family transcriptional regulator, iron-sulfur cluster assembly transcription factor
MLNYFSVTQKGVAMLNKRSMQGLKVVSHIASAPLHAPATAEQIAKKLEFSVSYVEGLLKDAKAAHLIRSIRGPGGGYQLAQALDSLSVWDVVSAYEEAMSKPEEKLSSPEAQLAQSLMDDCWAMEQKFLKESPLSRLVDKQTVQSPSSSINKMLMNFKPLPKAVLPMAPNSVFDLSNYMNLQAA